MKVRRIRTTKAKILVLLASISEEGSDNRGGGIGIGLDTYNNGAPFDVPLGREE